MLNHTTVFAIVLGIFLIAIFDIWQLVRKGYEATISWTLYTYAFKFPVIPFLFGLIAGHLFWGQSH